eukprot:TRINITY_DN18610_c0_g1_i1.p1 TRINITY_DN18610_c0_g1~~TRINITY_DN18610_c0_g1_i1.p1  ORF type:complete len:1044 (+),score=421.24 TRINITY_DN18610_c0_g1_i1:203-3334(+)
MPSFLKQLRFKSSSKQQYNVLSKSVYVLTVELLDNSMLECTLSSESTGRECMNNVCQRLGLLQSDLLGLRYVSKRKSYPKIRWVDLDRLLKKQLDKYASEPPHLYLGVMFYVNDVSLLEDPVTRYHYFLQLKLDVIEGRLRCNYEQAIVLASYSLQAEFGDHEFEKHTADYLRGFPLLPKPMIKQFEDKMPVLTEAIINQHASLRGIAQQLAEVYYVVGAQQLDGYGQECFLAKDNSGSEVLIGASLTGIVIRKGNGISPSFFKWNDITNLVNHKRLFGIEFQNCEYPLQFMFEEAESAKYVWKMCVMQHSFYKQHSSAVDESNELNITLDHYDDSKLIPATQNNNTISHHQELKPSYARSVNDLVDSAASNPSHHHPMDLNKTVPAYRPAPDYETAVKNKLYMAKGGYPIYNNTAPRHPEQQQIFLTQEQPLLQTFNSSCNEERAYLLQQQYSSTPELSLNPHEPEQILAELQRLNIYKHHAPPPPYPYNNAPAAATNAAPPPRISSNSTPDLASGLLYQDSSGLVGGSSPDLVSRRNLGLVYSNVSGGSHVSYETNRRQSFSGRSNLVKEEPIYQNQQQIHDLVGDKEPIYQNLLSFENKTEEEEECSSSRRRHQEEIHIDNTVNSGHQGIGGLTNSREDISRISSAIHGKSGSMDESAMSNESFLSGRSNKPKAGRKRWALNFGNKSGSLKSIKSEGGGKGGTERSPGTRSRPSMLAAFSGLTRSRPDLLNNSPPSEEDLLPSLRIASPSKMGKEEIGPYLEGKLLDGEVLREFEMIPKKRESSSFFAASLPENVRRNRFEHVLPYDDNRVKISPSKDNKAGYINASHVNISLKDSNRVYIAAQGPMPETISNFWEMIHQFNVRLIVMLADSRSVVQYWPSKTGSLLELKDFRIVKKSSSDSQSYVTSSLEILHIPSGFKRMLWHSQYTDWSERGIPNDPLRYVAFLEELEALRTHALASEAPSLKASPVLVHCSAGVGRTGVTILSDILLYCVDRNIHVDIPKILAHLRKQRMLMVQTIAQYQFIHTLLINYLKKSRLI